MREVGCGGLKPKVGFGIMAGMNDILQGFRFVSDGAVTLADALCRYVKEGIAVGRLKGGDRFPTIAEIAKATGLTFAQARRVTERLAREGYVRSRPHAGTVVRSRGGNVLHGRVLFALPDVDVCRYYPAQLLDTMRRKLSQAGYAFSVATFPLRAGARLDELELELLRAPDLVIAGRATPEVQACLAASGVNHVFAYGDKPASDAIPWIRVAPEAALVRFARHCAIAGVTRVVQVRFEDNAPLDVQPALEKKGIDCSWMTLTRGEGDWCFDSIARSAYETFSTLPRESFPDLFLFWNLFAAQGAVTAFLNRGICLPEDVKVATISNVGLCPIYPKSFSRFEADPNVAAEAIAKFALAILVKGRHPRPPKVVPQYVVGETFP